MISHEMPRKVSSIHYEFRGGNAGGRRPVPVLAILCYVAFIALLSGTDWMKLLGRRLSCLSSIVFCIPRPLQFAHGAEVGPSRYQVSCLELGLVAPSELRSRLLGAWLGHIGRTCISKARLLQRRPNPRLNLSGQAAPLAVSAAFIGFTTSAARPRP